MNVLALEQFHQRKQPETDNRPFEDPELFEHSADASAGQANAQAGLASAALLMEGRGPSNISPGVHKPMIPANELP